MAQIDSRLGSEGNTRPSLHQRIDGLERLLVAYDQKNDQVRGASDEALASLSAFLRDFRDRGFVNEHAVGVPLEAGQRLPMLATVDHEVPETGLKDVNARIVEHPFAFRALASLDPSSSALVVGGGDDLLPVSLASAGWHVWILDPRGLSLHHPNLDVLTSLDGGSPGPTVDAVVALTSLDSANDADARENAETLARSINLLREDGLAIVSTAIEPLEANATRDPIDIRLAVDLAVDLAIEHATVAWQTSPSVWELGDPENPQPYRGIAIVAARKTAGG